MKNLNDFIAVGGVGAIRGSVAILQIATVSPDLFRVRKTTSYTSDTSDTIDIKGFFGVPTSDTPPTNAPGLNSVSTLTSRKENPS